MDTCQLPNDYHMALYEGLPVLTIDIKYVNYVCVILGSGFCLNNRLFGISFSVYVL